MTLIGKLVGALLGYLLFRHPLGIAIGAALGHAWDEGWLRGLFPSAIATPEGALVAPLFGIAGAIAKSDGRVSEAEIAATERLMTRMGLDGRNRANAIESFNRGKEPGFDLHLAARDLRAFCGFRGEMKVMLLDVLADVALADGALAGAAREQLARVARSLDLAESTLEWLLTRKSPHASARTQHVADPYAVLGLTPQASDAEIRRTYRRLMAQHHPDKMTARGAPPEAVRLAEERAREINAAYEQLRSRRGFSQ